MDLCLDGFTLSKSKFNKSVDSIQIVGLNFTILYKNMQTWKLLVPESVNLLYLHTMKFYNFTSYLSTSDNFLLSMQNSSTDTKQAEYMVIKCIP